MDYKRLLHRYITHVGECEGTDFLCRDRYREKGRQGFTDEEWGELQALASTDWIDVPH